MPSFDPAQSTPGVVIRLVDLGNGQSRLVLDDVLADAVEKPKSWKFDCFYTSHELNSKLIDEMALPDSDYQKLGVVLLARLLALNGRVK